MFKKFFKKKVKDRSSIGLKDLLPGDMVDYDLKTWEVKAKNRYESDGDTSYEWQLASSDDMFFLQLDDEESDEYSISRKTDKSGITPSVFQYISESDDAPEKIEFQNKEYFLDEIYSAYFFKNCKEEGVPFISYEYISSDEETYLTIEQWGEKSFEVSIGHEAFDYQFTNFLPGAKVD